MGVFPNGPSCPAIVAFGVPNDFVYHHGMYGTNKRTVAEEWAFHVEIVAQIIVKHP